MNLLDTIRVMILCSSVFSFRNKAEHGIVEDLQHFELRHDEVAEPFVHEFEDFNYTAFEEQNFHQEFLDRYHKLKGSYDERLTELLNNSKVNKDNAGKHLTALFGEEYIKLKDDMKDMEIDLKAYLENELDVFFLYHCQNHFFYETKEFRHCTDIAKELRKKLLFENFFDFGFRNLLLELIETHEMEEEFAETLRTKLMEMRLTWKTLFQLVSLSVELFMDSANKRINEKFGKGIDVEVNIKQ